MKTNSHLCSEELTALAVLRVLADNPDITQKELALTLSMSVGRINYCLKALIEKGWVKMKNLAQSKNKFGYIYVLTPRGVGEKAQLMQRFLARKRVEYEALRQEIDRLRAELGSQAQEDCSSVGLPSDAGVGGELVSVKVSS